MLYRLALSGFRNGAMSLLPKELDLWKGRSLILSAGISAHDFRIPVSLSRLLTYRAWMVGPAKPAVVSKGPGPLNP